MKSSKGSNFEGELSPHSCSTRAGFELDDASTLLFSLFASTHSRPARQISATLHYTMSTEESAASVASPPLASSSSSSSALLPPPPPPPKKKHKKANLPFLVHQRYLAQQAKVQEEAQRRKDAGLPPLVEPPSLAWNVLKWTVLALATSILLSRSATGTWNWGYEGKYSSLSNVSRSSRLSERSWALMTLYGYRYTRQCFLHLKRTSPSSSSLATTVQIPPTPSSVSPMAYLRSATP